MAAIPALSRVGWSGVRLATSEPVVYDGPVESSPVNHVYQAVADDALGVPGKGPTP